MKLSVIIPCFNAAGAISGQLEALSAQSWNDSWEVIVSDNGSSDGSVAIAETYKERLPCIRIVDSSDRRGAAHARNVAVREAAGDAIAFCDADDEVGPGWVAAMGDALGRYEFVACRVDFTKLNPPWVQELFHEHAQGHGRLLEAWYPPYLCHAGGGTLGVRKSLHETIGGFDESLHAHEDTDYCFRIQQLGVKLHLVPEALLHIRSRNTLNGLFRQARKWAQYNILVYKKYRPSETSELWRWGIFATQCKDLLYTLPEVRSLRTGRAAWLWRLGWQLGRLEGSIKHHVPPV